ncbi:MAG TPA: nitrous oxide reductase accessory protein NosL, partial [Ferruginibacter sp.]|nr:nitrous oxide reductase accessory protein NosL [Ferruginibacter sp.]
AIVAAFFLTALIPSCNTGPEPIKIGADNCYACKMTISDIRFGAELVTQKGKVYKFDDAQCLLGFLKSKAIADEDIKDIYLVNFNAAHELLNIKDCQLLQAEGIKGPMGGNIAAFNNSDSLKKAQAYFTGAIVKWNEINSK